MTKGSGTARQCGWGEVEAADTTGRCEEGCDGEGRGVQGEEGEGGESGVEEGEGLRGGGGWNQSNSCDLERCGVSHHDQ